METLMSDLKKRPIIFVGGKGGVGKTTHAASIACRLAAMGKRVLIISTDPAHSLGDVLKCALSGNIERIHDTLFALELDVEALTDRHFANIFNTLSSYTKPEMLKKMRQHFETSKSSPGAKEAALLEAICHHLVNYEALGFDHVVFDTAPTGHTLHLLELPKMMQAWTDSLLAQHGEQNRLREAALPFWKQQSRETSLLSDATQTRWEKALNVLQIRRELFAQAGKVLHDRTQTTIILVMIPEALPFEETRRALAQLQHVKLPCQHIILNQILPKTQADHPFWQQRQQRQQIIFAQIRRELSSVFRHDFALQATDIRGVTDLATWGNEAYLGSEAPRFRPAKKDCWRWIR